MSSNIKIPSTLIQLLKNLPKTVHGQYRESQKVVTISHDTEQVHLELLVSLQNDHHEFNLHALMTVDQFDHVEIVNLQGSPDHFKKSENRYLEAMFNIAIRILQHHLHDLIPEKTQNPQWKKTLQELLNLGSIGQDHLVTDYVSKNFIKMKYMSSNTRIWHCLRHLSFQNLALSVDWRDIEDVPELAEDTLTFIQYKDDFSYQALSNFDIENDDETLFIDDLKKQLSAIGIHLISIETHADDYFFLLSLEKDYAPLLSLLDHFNIEYD